MSTVNRWLDDVSPGVSLRAVSALTYRKSEADSLLSDKVDRDDVYHKTEVDSLLIDRAGFMRYPPMKMTSDNTISTRMGTFSVDSSPGTNSAYQAFDYNTLNSYQTADNTYNRDTGLYEGSVSTFGGNGSVSPGEWVELTCEKEFTLKMMSVFRSSYGGPNDSRGLALCAPRDFTILAKISAGGDFVVIKSFTDLEAISSSSSEFIKPHIFNLEENETPYKIYRFVISKTNRASTVLAAGNTTWQTRVVLGELGLYGGVMEALQNNNTLYNNTTPLNDKTDEYYDMMI
jgi:hypothetical protein